MFKWEEGCKILHCKFGGLIPIAGFALFWDREDREWKYSRNVRSVLCHYGEFVFGRGGVASESVTNDLIGMYRDVLGRLGVSVDPESINLTEDAPSSEVSPVGWLFLRFGGNRTVGVEGVSVDRDLVKTYACTMVSVQTTELLAFFYQNWWEERTEVLFSFRPDLSEDRLPRDEAEQRRHLVESMKTLLHAYQFRCAIPSEDIKRVEESEEVVVGSDKFRELLWSAFPRPWYLAAMVSKEDRDKYVGLYRDVVGVGYRVDPSVVPRPLQWLAVPKYDLSGLIKGWSVDTSSMRKAAESVVSRVLEEVSVDPGEPRKSPPEVLSSGRGHPFDVANTICEVLRQVDRVFGASWTGGGVPCKACVLDGGPRAAVKTYDVGSDDWVLTEVGRGFGECGDYNRKTEWRLIP